MSWDAPKREGLALAALIHDDRRLAHVQSALPPAELRAAETLLSELSRAGPRGRPQALASLMASLRPALSARSLALPPRMRALVASKVAKHLGRRLLQDVSPTRIAFHPAPSLTPALLRIARALERSDS